MKRSVRVVKRSSAVKKPFRISVNLAAPKSRFLYRCNPIAVLAATFLLTITLLLTIDLVSASVAVGLELILFIFEGWSIVGILRRGWPVLIVLPLAGLSMLLYGRASGQVFWEFGLARISAGSLNFALAVTVRAFAVALPSLLMLSRVNQIALADGLAQICRLPSRIVIGSFAGIRLIVLMRNDWVVMQRSRRARGIGDHAAIRRLVTMVFAMLVLALRRASSLALAMEARGFGAFSERTWARDSRLGWPDLGLLLLAVGVAVAALVTAVVCGTFQTVWG